jgi:hypothetical protein
MARWKLKSKCLFVDAQDLDDPKHPKRYPTEIPFAHILDKNTKDCLKLNDTAGVIARFIVIGIDTDLIPQIIFSEYGGTKAEPVAYENRDAQSEAEIKTAVNFVLQKLLSFLEPRTLKDCNRPYSPPLDYPVEKHEGKYKLDFSVNFVGTTCCKIPPPPPPPTIG